ncbi:hypothetical protein JQ584_50685 [Bradyrhizobium liaoningense]|nr:hypothetical protein [Bradyrhizobium liaoningense]
MSEMIERAAKAIFRTHHEAALIGWDDLSEQAKEEFMTQGRAVIEAIREPTVEMCRDAAWDDYGPDECRTCWQAMIDAALAKQS